MRRYAGRLVGIIIGLTGGWYGVIVGLLIGTLFDHLLENRRRSRGLEEFLSTGRGPKADRLELWVLAALATRLITLAGAPLKEQFRDVRDYLGRRFDLRDSRIDDLMTMSLFARLPSTRTHSSSGGSSSGGIEYSGPKRLSAGSMSSRENGGRGSALRNGSGSGPLRTKWVSPRIS